LITIKRIAALTLISSMVLAGCDSGSPTATPVAALPTNTVGAAPAGETPTAVTAEATATTAEATATTAVPMSESGRVINTSVSGEIEMWHFWSSPLRRNAIRRVIGICSEQLPNIKVTDVAKPFNDLWTANVAAVAAGSGMPDVIISDRPKLAQDAANNVYTDLQEFIDRDKVNSEDYWPFTWQQTLYQDHSYGIPFETDVRVLYYNKNAFKDAGLDPEKPPKTWEELMDTAAKLDKKNEDGTYSQIGLFPLFGNASPYVWGFTNDVEWITPDQKPAVNTPQAVETLNYIKSWVDHYGGWQNIQTFQGSFQSAPNDAFMSGKVAMIVDINGYARVLNFYNPSYKNADGTSSRLDWGVSDIPYKTDNGSWSGGFAMSIPKGAEHTDAAWEFIKCATDAEGSASWSLDTYAMSAHVDAADDPRLMADPAWTFFLKAMEYSSGGNYLTKYANWEEQLTQRYEKVWTGEITAEQALNEAQTAIEAEINK